MLWEEKKEKSVKCLDGELSTYSHRPTYLFRRGLSSVMEDEEKEPLLRPPTVVVME